MTDSLAWTNAVRTLQWHRYSRDVEPHRSDLYAHCCGLTADPTMADDLAQETLMRGFGVVSQLNKGMHRPRSYLFRVASNLWIDWCRRANREDRRDDQVGDPEATQPSRLPELQEADAALRALLSRTEYQAYVMRYVYRFTAKEAAALIGSTAAAIKMAASRARRKVEAAAADGV